MSTPNWVKPSVYISEVDSYGYASINKRGGWIITILTHRPRWYIAVILKLITQNGSLCIFYEIAVRWMSQNLDNKRSGNGFVPSGRSLGKFNARWCVFQLKLTTIYVLWRNNYSGNEWSQYIWLRNPRWHTNDALNTYHCDGCHMVKRRYLSFPYHIISVSSPILTCHFPGCDWLTCCWKEHTLGKAKYEVCRERKISTINKKRYTSRIDKIREINVGLWYYLERYAVSQIWWNICIAAIQ